MIISKCLNVDLIHYLSLKYIPLIHMAVPFVNGRRTVFYKWQVSAGNLSAKLK